MKNSILSAMDGHSFASYTSDWQESDDELGENLPIVYPYSDKSSL